MDHLSVEDLRKMTQGDIVSLAERGIISITMLQQMPMTKFETPEYKQYQHLQGIGISLSEASRRYEIAKSTISGWIARGLIRAIQDDGYRLLVDEADMAYCVTIYRRNPGTGRWIFNADGTPYVKQRCK